MDCVNQNCHEIFPSNFVNVHLLLLILFPFEGLCSSVRHSGIDFFGALIMSV